MEVVNWLISVSPNKLPVWVDCVLCFVICDLWSVARDALASTVTLGFAPQYEFPFIISFHSKPFDVLKVEVNDIVDEKEREKIVMKADVYALGIVIHEILLGTKPLLWKNEKSRHFKEASVIILYIMNGHYVIL